MRRTVASAKILLLMLVPVSSRGDVLTEVAESVGLVPGVSLARPAESVIETGVAQLLTFAEARAAWVRTRLPVHGPWHVELLGARTRAGAWGEERHEARLIARGQRVALAVGAARVRARLEDWVDLHHGRGWAEVAYRLGPAQVGVRWEGPWRDAPAWPGSSVQLHVVAEGSGWVVGLWRPRAATVNAVAWGAGFAASLHEQLRLGMRLRAERVELLLWVKPGPWRVSLVVPVASLVGAGPTLAVGWAP